MSATGQDIEQLAAVLAPIEATARGQRWDRERPWRVETHLWVEEGLVVLDLHDLGAKGAKQAVRTVLALASDKGLASGAVAFVTGRGRRSAGNPVLKELVGRRLAAAAGDHADWSMHVVGAGRICLVTDPSKAPRKAQNSLGWGFWLLVAGLVAAAVWACMGTPGAG